MTKRDYIAAAAMFKALLDANHEQAKNTVNYGYVVGARGGIKVSARAMAGLFAADNPRFNREKFLTACGL